MGHLIPRTTFEVASAKILDVEGMFCICSQLGADNCRDITVKNNIAGGGLYAGFLYYGHSCNQDGSHLANNTAHSLNGVKSGHGLILFTGN